VLLAVRNKIRGKYKKAKDEQVLIVRIECVKLKGKKIKRKGEVSEFAENKNK